MAQIKIYGIKEKLAPVRRRLSDTIHECVMEALQFPADKRAHRFFMMDKEDFYYPAGRSDAYIRELVARLVVVRTNAEPTE